MPYYLNQDEPFPPISGTVCVANISGLIAITKELSPKRLLEAYELGIFPWNSEDQNILWWSLDPRMILEPKNFKISTNLGKFIKQVLRQEEWEIRVDCDFNFVMRMCANISRQNQNGTWITQEVLKAYYELHTKNLAHSIEVWHNNKCVAGLYGVALGRMFFGESMFSLIPNCSKLALASLCAFLQGQQVQLIDCQQETGHLASLGAYSIPRTKFLEHVHFAVKQAPIAIWQFDKTILE